MQKVVQWVIGAGDLKEAKESYEQAEFRRSHS